MKEADKHTNKRRKHIEHTNKQARQLVGKSESETNKQTKNNNEGK